MKKLILIALLAIGAMAKAQKLPIDSATQSVVYSEVIRVDSVSKDELYNRAREWFAKEFRSANSVLQMDDKVSGRLVGKAIEIGTVSPAPLIFTGFTERYTVSIYLKDGKYKYVISDFTVENEVTQGIHHPEVSMNEYATNPKWKNSSGEYRKVIRGYVETTVKINDLISSSLKSAMAKPSTGSKSKDDF